MTPIPDKKEAMKEFENQVSRHLWEEVEIGHQAVVSRISLSAEALLSKQRSEIVGKVENLPAYDPLGYLIEKAKVLSILKENE
jgi:hypothetical protein